MKRLVYKSWIQWASVCMENEVAFHDNCKAFETDISGTEGIADMSVSQPP